MGERFSTHVLDKAIQHRKEANERLRLVRLGRAFDALQKLAGEVLFEEAYLFGSLARPYGFLENSDIDIGFIGLKDRDFFVATAFLSRELSVDVDVVQLEGHRMEEKVRQGGIRWVKKG